MNIKHLRQDIIRCLFLLICLFTSLSSWAHDEEIDNIIYSIDENNNTATVTGVSDKSITSAVIKGSVSGCKVTSIGGSAFSGCSSLTSVTIPSSVTSIGGDAFYKCSSLTSVTIPSSVTSIGFSTFAYCSSLTSVTIPSSVTSIGSSAFYKCSSLTSVTIPSLVTSIGFSTFAYCSNLTSVTIPSSVTSIGSDAFNCCSSLTSVTIPSSVTSIDERAFWGCSSLTSVTIPSSVTSISKQTFNACNNLTSVTIPSSVTSIGEHAFWGCSSLTSVTIPSSVTSIGNSAFAYCSSLTSVTIPSSVTSIDDYTFYECSSLTSVTIPSSVTSIGKYTFYECSSLTSVTIPSSVIGIDYSAFSNCSSLTSIYIPSTLRRISNNAFYGCYNLCMAISEKGTSAAFVLSCLPNDLLSNRVKSNDYYEIYSTKKITQAQDKLFDDYFKAKSLVDSHKETYDLLDKNLCADFEKAMSSVLVSINLNEAEVTDCNKSLLDAYNFIYEKLNGPYSNELYMVYKEAISEKDSVWGKPLILDANQLSTNAQEPTQGSLGALIDNDIETYFHSARTTTEHTNEFHYLQIDLNIPCSNIVLKYSIRSGRFYEGTPKVIHVYATNTPDNEYSWEDLDKKNCTYNYVPNETGVLTLDLNDSYRYVRLVVEETMSNSRYNGNLYFYWSELQAYAPYRLATLTDDELSAFDEAIASAKSELQAGNATKQTYLALKNELEKLNVKTENAEVLNFLNSDHITLYSDKALVVPRGIKAAVVTGNGNGIRSDYRYQPGMVIPAHTGVLLKNEICNRLYIAKGKTSGTAPADNLLHGTLSDETTKVTGDNKYYKLAYDAATGKELGFYWGTEDGAPFVNKAGKAFLAIPTTASQSLMGISLFDLDNGMTTGITETETSGNAPLRIYDLNGRRIEKTSLDGLQPGIYVVNGKKMYVK